MFKYLTLLILVLILLSFSFGCVPLNQMAFPDGLSTTDLAVGGLVVGGVVANAVTDDDAIAQPLHPIDETTDDGSNDNNDDNGNSGGSVTIDKYTVSNLTGPIFDKDLNGADKLKFGGIIKSTNDKDVRLWFEVKYLSSSGKVLYTDSYREPFAVMAGRTRPFAIYRDYDPSIARIEVYSLSNIEEIEEEEINLKFYGITQSGNSISGKVFNLSDDSIDDLAVIVAFYDKNKKLVDVQISRIDSLASQEETTFSVTSIFTFYSYDIATTYDATDSDIATDPSLIEVGDSSTDTIQIENYELTSVSVDRDTNNNIVVNGNILNKSSMTLESGSVSMILYDVDKNVIQSGYLATIADTKLAPNESSTFSASSYNDTNQEVKYVKISDVIGQ